MTEPARHDPENRPVWARDAARKASGLGGASFKGLILNLISLALVMAAVAFFAAPAVTFFGIRAAAKAGDVAGLSQLIDYDAVRSSLRPQVSGRIEPLTPPPSFIQDPLGAMRRQFDQAVTPRAPDAPDVEAFLTPSALAALTLGAGRSAPEAHEVTRPDRLPRPVYWSVNRARLAVSGETAGRTVFTFERRGPYEWMLVHIGLPPEEPVTSSAS